MKEDPTNPLRALGVDVLAPEGSGEIIGGGQREAKQGGGDEGGEFRFHGVFVDWVLLEQ